MAINATTTSHNITTTPSPFSSPIKDNVTILNESLLKIQERTFVNWINYQFLINGLNDEIDNLTKDIKDSLIIYKLLNLLHRNSNTNIDRNDVDDDNGDDLIIPEHLNPKLNVQFIANWNKLLDYLKTKMNLKLFNISSQDILDSNLKLILILIWQIIQNNLIVYKYLDNYDNHHIYDEKEIKLLILNFVKSSNDSKFNISINNWNNLNNGIIILNLIHNKFNSKLFKLNDLNNLENFENFELILEIGEKFYNIPKLINSIDFINNKIDENSIVIYLSFWFNYYNKNLKNIEKNELLDQSSIISNDNKEQDNDNDGDEGDDQIQLSITKTNKKLLKLRFQTFIKILSIIINFKNNYNKQFSKIKLLIDSNLNYFKNKNNIKDLKQFKKISNSISSEFYSISNQLDMELNILHCDLDTIEDDNSQDQVKSLTPIYNKLKSLDSLFANLKIIINNLKDNFEYINDVFNNYKFDELLNKYNYIEFDLKNLKEIILDRLTFIDSQFAIKDDVLKILLSTYHEKNSTEEDKLIDNLNDNFKNIKVSENEDDLTTSNKNTIQFNTEEINNFEKIFNKFDNGDKNYLTKNEFLNTLKYIYPNIKEDYSKELFEIAYENSNSILRGIKFDGLLEILNYMINGDDNNGNDDDNVTTSDFDKFKNLNIDKEIENGINKPSNTSIKSNGTLTHHHFDETSIILNDDSIDITGDLIVNTFKEISNGKNYLTDSDLKEIDISNENIEKINSILNNLIHNNNDNNSLNFNYLKFFDNINESEIYHQSTNLNS
ncbi:hypothetical protein B5S27_g2859 [[Candida] boidinii]|nr:hypothetical protein B5S27_g2859 [[Candida] boidinii]